MLRRALLIFNNYIFSVHIDVHLHGALWCFITQLCSSTYHLLQETSHSLMHSSLNWKSVCAWSLVKLLCNLTRSLFLLLSFVNGWFLWKSLLSGKEDLPVDELTYLSTLTPTYVCLCQKEGIIRATWIPNITKQATSQQLSQFSLIIQLALAGYRLAPSLHCLLVPYFRMSQFPLWRLHFQDLPHHWCQVIVCCDLIKIIFLTLTAL